MPTLTPVQVSCILLFMSVWMNLCLGTITLCSNKETRLQNGTSVLAKKGDRVTVSFCVQSDYLLHGFVTITHPDRKSNYSRNGTVTDGIHVLITGDMSNATVKVTINEVGNQDYGDFSVDVYKHGVRLTDKVRFSFHLIRPDKDSTSVLPTNAASLPPQTSKESSQAEMFMYLYITVPAVITLAIVAISAVLICRYRAKSRDAGVSDKPLQSKHRDKKKKMKNIDSDSRLSGKVHCQESDHTLSQEGLLYTTIAEQASHGKKETSQESGHTLSEEGLVYTTIAKQTGQKNMNQSQGKQETDHTVSQDGLVYATVAKQPNEGKIKPSQAKQESSHTVSEDGLVYTTIAKKTSPEKMTPPSDNQEPDHIISDEGLVYTTIAHQARPGKHPQAQGKKEQVDHVEYCTLDFNKDRGGS